MFVRMRHQLKIYLDQLVSYLYQCKYTNAVSSDVYLVLFCSSIVALVVYFVVGSLAMFYVKKARGIE